MRKVGFQFPRRRASTLICCVSLAASLQNARSWGPLQSTARIHTPPSIKGCCQLADTCMQARDSDVSMLPPKRLLFIGDSLTYCNDLDHRVAALARAAGFAEGLCVDRVVLGGAPLKRLWNKSKAKKVIHGTSPADGGASAPWDVVVLQEDLPETDIATFNTFVDRFHTHIHASGAVTVLLAAWPYARLPTYDTEAIAVAHEEAKKKMSSETRLVHIGRAWAKAVDERPDVVLYAPDLEHPAPDGTALAAACVFSTLWHKCAPLPPPLPGAGNSEEEERLSFLHRIAWQVCNGE